MTISDNTSEEIVVPCKQSNLSVVTYSLLTAMQTEHQKSAITAMRFNVEDMHLLRSCK